MNRRFRFYQLDVGEKFTYMDEEWTVVTHTMEGERSYNAISERGEKRFMFAQTVDVKE